MTRKFEIIEADGVLTVQSVKTGWTGRRTEHWTQPLGLAIGLIFIFRHFFQGAERVDNILCLVALAGFSVLLIARLYQVYFGSSRLVVDVPNDKFQANQEMPLKLSDVQRIRIVTPFYNLFPAGWGFRVLVVDLTPSRQRVVLRSGFGGAQDVAQLEELVLRTNAFLTERVTTERRTRNTIWSWELGQNVPTEGFYNGRL
ncbi:MAG: hypothetical protein ABIY70_10580 [Capsulimonas sp.]|uniref:hypothetical protein n=1 Tax=Capsulimonas sp. TaxID=2494211 RepID=UPI00326684AC